MAIIYKHIRKDTNEVFYIGIGNDISRAYDVKNRKNKHWHGIVKKYGYLVEIVETNLSWQDACEKEKQLIKEYGRLDLNLGKLVNMTDGGDGQCNPSEETRGKLKYSKTEEHKNKLRIYQLGVKQTNETIQKRINTGFHKTDEYKQKMSIALSGENNPMKKEENKQKLRKPKPPRTKEHSKKISDSKKGKAAHNKGKSMKKYKCELCGIEIGGAGNLSQHIKNKHGKL